MGGGEREREKNSPCSGIFNGPCAVWFVDEAIMAELIIREGGTNRSGIGLVSDSAQNLDRFEFEQLGMFADGDGSSLAARRIRDSATHLVSP
jgi:hypothetical protein